MIEILTHSDKSTITSRWNIIKTYTGKDRILNGILFLPKNEYSYLSQYLLTSKES